MTFREKHAGQPLPPIGKKLKEKEEVHVDPDLIPLCVQGLMIPVTEQEAIGLKGQIEALLKSRRQPGVFGRVFKNA